MSFTLYILKSQIKNRYYIGHTNNLERRITEHNSGQTKFTKPYRPWKVVYHKIYNNKSDAAKAEILIKSKKSRVFIEKLILGEMSIDR